MSVREYIGARYVPLFAEPMDWDKTRTYEPLTIVLYQGNSFTSRQHVPKDIEITDDRYWAQTGNYNAQVEAYRREVMELDERVDELEDPIEQLGVYSSGNRKYSKPTPIFTADFDYDHYYVQSMCYVLGHMYMYIIPRSGETGNPFIGKFTMLGEREAIYEITDADYQGHGNSMTYWAEKQMLVYPGPNNLTLCCFSLLDQTFSKFDTWTTYQYSEFAINGDDFVCIERTSRMLLSGKHLDGQFIVLNSQPISNVGEGVGADIALTNQYAYINYYYSATNNGTITGKRMQLLKIINPTYGYEPYEIVIDMNNEIEGVEIYSNSIYVCDELGNVYLIGNTPTYLNSSYNVNQINACMYASYIFYRHTGTDANTKNHVTLPYMPFNSDVRLFTNSNPCARAFQSVIPGFVDGYNKRIIFDGDTLRGHAHIEYAYDTTKKLLYIYWMTFVDSSDNTHEFYVSAGIDDMDTYLAAWETFLDGIPTASLPSGANLFTGIYQIGYYYGNASSGWLSYDKDNSQYFADFS